jgi:hypothetical protein
VGELAAEPGVLVGECLVALQSSDKPGMQRGVGRSLACRDGSGGFGVAGAAQPLDLVPDVGLGMERARRMGGDLGKATWRTDRYTPCTRDEAAAWFRFLAGIGYELSLIEQDASIEGDRRSG